MIIYNRLIVFVFESEIYLIIIETDKAEPCSDYIIQTMPPETSNCLFL